MDIGNSLEELRIKHNGKIYLLFGNGWVDVLDANGNLNVKIKNTINSGVPTSDSPDGFYYDGTNIYMKLGSNTINMTESSLPEGSIIMYEGDEAPDGWYKYADSDEFNGVIYIINKSGSTPTIANVILRWNPSTNPIRTTLGESFTSPVLEKIVSGNIPLIIDYSSSDTSKAIIDGNGNVTLKAAGQTTIKAETAANSLHKAASTSYVLIISEPTIEKKTITLNWSGSVLTLGQLNITKGDTYITPVLLVDGTDSLTTFKRNYVTYSSSDINVATVSKDSQGNLVLTIVNPGSATILAETEYDSEAENLYTSDRSIFYLLVSERDTSITVNPSQITIPSDIYSGTITVESGSNWNAVSNQSWCNIHQLNGSTILVAISANDDTSSRNAVITVSNDDGNSETITVTLAGHSGVRPDEDRVKSFATLIDEFNNKGIYSPSILNSGNTSDIYNYLEDMYNKSRLEYEGNSELFLSSTYESLEVYNYHGNNNDYELDGTAENAMLYWIIATCLAELVPTSGSNNKQTRLFKFAYDLGGNDGDGRKYRLYNSYTPKGDLTICRLVASTIYAKNRPTYKNNIPTFRNKLNGSTISISGTLEDGLNLKISDSGVGYKPKSYGYSVDIDSIFPAAAGPYTTTGSYANRSAYPWDQQGENHDSFNSSTKNYIIDEEINNEVITNYNLKNNSNSIKFKRAIQAIADDYEGINHYLDDKIYYTYPDNSSDDCTYPHDRFRAATSSSNKGYFTGTFNTDVVTSKNLSLYKNTQDFTNFLNEVRDACGYNRSTTLWPLYGRRRPSQGEEDGSCASEDLGLDECYHNNLNWLDDFGILFLSGGSTGYDDTGEKYYKEINNITGMLYDESSYYPHGCGNIKSTTYPSGHSGNVWGAALTLIELLSDMGITNNSEINRIYKAAYAFTVSRTIVRAHWNSDTIYGKLSATTIFPVLHAMSTFNNMFNNAEQALNSTPINKHNIDIAFVESFDGTSPAKTGVKGTTFKQPTLYIKENNIVYTLDDYPYASQLKPLLTYKFYDSSYSSYASINSSNGLVILSNVTPSSLNSDRGIRIEVEVANNDIFTNSFSPGETISAHFYIKIVEQAGDMQINVIIDNQTGDNAYITGEILYFIQDNSGTEGVVYTCSDENVANDDDGKGDGEPNNITLIKLTPGENLLHFSYVEYSYGFNRDNTPITFRTKNDDTKKKDEYGNIIKVSQKLRVYAHGITEHERCAFISTIESGNEFKEDNITYRIKIEKGTDYDLMYKPSTPTSSISVSPSNVSFQASGGTESVSVTTNSSTWSAMSGANWCTTNKSGNTLSISASANTDSRRTTTITITDGNNNTATINVSQSGAGSSDIPLYSVGLLSDIHYATRKDVNRPITTKSDGNSSSSTTGNTYSYYLEDLSYLIRNIFLDVDFIASPGDITEYNINDLIVFTTGYKSAYNNNPKPFYCATGNHDHGIIYCVGNTRAQDSNGTEIGDSTGGRWNSITYGGTTYQCPGSLATTISGLSKSDFYSGSKSYYISYKGDMYIFMMADYGSTNGMSDVHPHNMISSSQITTLKSKISNYTFPDNESNLNFLYYKYEDLIKLEELLRTNSSKRIFIFSHYFLPHKAGGGNKYLPGESTELMGITFHFLNYLNNTYTNTIWFSGHTHISWLDNTVKGLHWTNTNYDYIKPTSSDNSSMTYNDNLGLYKISGSNKIYNRNGSNKLNNNPTAWNIHLPSMSRPVNTSGKQLGNCEAAIMRVYDDRVEIEKVGYSTSNGSSYTQYNIPDSLLTIYNDGTGECNDTAPEISEESTPSDDGITVNITNNSSSIARLNGKLVFNITNGSRTSQENGYLSGYNSGYDNPITINPGETYSGIVSSFAKQYTDSPEPSEFLNGSWSTQGGVNIYTYSAMYYGKNSADDKKDGEPHSSNGMYIVTPPSSNNIPITSGTIFNYNITNISKTDGTETIYPLEITDNTHYYVLGPNGKLRRNGTDYTIVKGDPTGNATKSGVPNTA